MVFLIKNSCKSNIGQTEPFVCYPKEYIENFADADKKCSWYCPGAPSNYITCQWGSPTPAPGGQSTPVPTTDPNLGPAPPNPGFLQGGWEYL